MALQRHLAPHARSVCESSIVCCSYPNRYVPELSWSKYWCASYLTRLTGSLTAVDRVPDPCSRVRRAEAPDAPGIGGDQGAAQEVAD
jgi:hypothetical protein